MLNQHTFSDILSLLRFSTILHVVIATPATTLEIAHDSQKIHRLSYDSRAESL